MDANGNQVKIIGEMDSQIITPKGSIHTSVLVFRKNPAVMHHILLGMNVLKHGDIKFSSNKIIFNNMVNRESTTSDDVFKLRLIDKKIHGVLRGQEIFTHQPNEIPEPSEAKIQRRAPPTNLLLYLTKEILVPKNSLNILAIDVNIDSVSDIIINANQLNNVFIPLMYTEVKQNKLNIQMANLTDEDIVLKAGTEIGQGEVTSTSPNQYLNVAQLSRELTKENPLRPLTEEDIQCDDPQMTKELLQLLNQ